MTTSHVATLTACFLALAANSVAAASLAEDAVSVVQAAVTAESHLAVEAKGGNGEVPPEAAPRAPGPPPPAAGGRRSGREEPSYCPGQVQMDLDRRVVTNNLGGVGPTSGDPVIHIQNFVDLADGRKVDLVVSNLTEYNVNNFHLNGLNGEFNNINIIAGSVDLLFTFKDSATQLPLEMPAFNMTIYDLDGPAHDVYAERVSINTDDFDSYNLTTSTDVIVSETGDKTNFGSSSWGLRCDNPSSIETTGIVSCTTGTLDQRDRAVAVQMKGGKSSYHITLWASSVAQIGRNFLFGLPAYFNVVCHAPTNSPTPAPSSPPTYPVASSFGDPHVSNLKGERFDILRTDYHTFLVIPRGADAEDAFLHVVAKVDPLGPLCSGLLFVTSLKFSGRWVGHIGTLEFTTSVDAAMDPEKAMKIKAGSSSHLNVSQFRDAVPQSLAEVTVLHPQEPQSVNQHVDLVLVKLKLGPSIAQVRMVYQKEKAGFSNSLWLTTTGLGHVHEEIGGILGFDNHTLASSRPNKCVESGGRRLPRSQVAHGSVHASASLEDLDG